MTRRKFVLIVAGASIACAAPAQAQHQGHNMPGMTMPMPKKAPPKRPAARKPAAKQATPKKSAPARKAVPAKKAPVKKAVPAKRQAPAKARPTAADPHAGHDMSAMPAPAAPVVDPHAGHDMPAATLATDPHAGHDMATMPGGAAAGTDLPAGNAPPPPVPTDSAADTVYGRESMTMGRHHLMTMHGGQRYPKVMLNIAEYQVRRGRDGYEWDGEASYGGDIHRVLFKSEGDGAIGRSVEKAEVHALYSRAIGPYFNLQGGVRYDIKPNPSRVYAAIGAEGLAPGFFDVEGTVFLSNKGELLARAEGYYDQRITQRLILQPRVEVNFAAQNSRDIGVGAGLSDAEFGLRLRYDIRREFAPYVGVQYRRAFGKTRDYLRATGEENGGFSLLAGIRMWF